MNQASFSLWELVLHADFFVQLILLLLLSASIFSWMLILKSQKRLKQHQRQNRLFENAFWQGEDLSALYQSINPEQDTHGLAQIFYHGFQEFLKLQKRQSIRAAAQIDGVQRMMSVALSRAVGNLEQNIQILSTIGAVSPYVGLLGTVWGIMSAFQALGGMQQVTISMVAPGISEALIATALGLFVAIPAMIAYNRFMARIQDIEDHFDNFKEEFTEILHREVHAQPAEAGR